jgi:hypothetical protein
MHRPAKISFEGIGFPLILAGGLRAFFADVVSTPLPKRLASLVHLLSAAGDERSGRSLIRGQAQQKRRAVLIVEDDAELRMLTAALFEDEQIDTIECESAEAALATLLIGGREVAMCFQQLGNVSRTSMTPSQAPCLRISLRSSSNSKRRNRR